jgi:hypothetical protein
MLERLNKFFSELEQIITKPAETLGKIMKDKKWVPAITFILIIIFILSFISLPYTLDKMSEVMKNSQMANFFEEHNLNYDSLSFIQKIFFVFPELLSVFIIIGIGAFFTYLFFGVGGAEGLYVNYFALVSAASLIDIVFPKIVDTFSSIFHLNILGYFSPAFLFGMSGQKTFLSIFISRFDYFSIWYAVAIALGIAYYAKLSVKKSMTISFIYLLFKVLIISLFTLFFAGSMQ